MTIISKFNMRSFRCRAILDNRMASISIQMLRNSKSNVKREAASSQHRNLSPAVTLQRVNVVALEGHSP
jgi:hypothetical protein